MSTLMFSEFADFIQGELHFLRYFKKNIGNNTFYKKI